MKLNQIDVEKRLSDIVPHGMREKIARGTGIYPKIVDAWLNADDERKSPWFTVLHIQSVLDEVAPVVGDDVWNEMTAMREASRPPRSEDDLCVEHELGRLSKEVADVIVAKCEGKPYHDQLREISEARAQLDRYEQALHGRERGSLGETNGR